MSLKRYYICDEDVNGTSMDNVEDLSKEFDEDEDLSKEFFGEVDVEDLSKESNEDNEIDLTKLDRDDDPRGFLQDLYDGYLHEVKPEMDELINKIKDIFDSYAIIKAAKVDNIYDLKEAMAQGNLSENAEYKKARLDQAEIEKLIMIYEQTFHKLRNECDEIIKKRYHSEAVITHSL